MPLGVQPTILELTDTVRSLTNAKAVKPDGVPVELSKNTLNGDPALRQRLLKIEVCFGGVAKSRSSGNMSSSWYFLENKLHRVQQLQGHLAGSARPQDTAEDNRSPPQRVLRARGDPVRGIEWFPTEPSYHRYVVWGSSATGVGAK